MPGRVSRSATSQSGAKSAKKGNQKRKQRSLNAFAIAAKQHPEHTKIRQHRLGDAEGEEPRRKRQRLADDEEEEGDEAHASNARRLQQEKVRKDQRDDLDIEAGSDSEGNEWRMGDVNTAADSDIDSDEALGDSDEERFEGFAFRGSKNGKPLPKSSKKSRVRDDPASTLDEEHQESEVDESDGFGSDAIDLADALDQSESEEEQDTVPNAAEDTQVGAQIKKAGEPHSVDREAEGAINEHGDDETAGSFSEFEDEDSSNPFDSEDESDENQPEKFQRLQNLVASLPRSTTKDDSHQPSALRPTAASMLASLKTMSSIDPVFSRSVRKLDAIVNNSNKDLSDRNGMVQPPLPKRQQDRLDRAAAFSKAKETLNRWLETVKYNRRAEHLTFPLLDPGSLHAPGLTSFLPTSAKDPGAVPQNELESTVQAILQESGLVGSANTEETRLRAAEEQELKANNVPVEEIMARRAELSKARDLLFREELKAKRIKKIKSKAYRRVHRKQAERIAQKERDLHLAAGLLDDDSEGERERFDRRRAEQRMGKRHKESRWAKAAKAQGQTKWDQETRDSVADMAKRNEDLLKRMEGRQTHDNDDDHNDLTDSEGSSDEEDVDPFDEEDMGGQRIAEKLRADLDRTMTDEHSGSKSKLGSMLFMQRADAALKRQNEENAEMVRRDLADEDSLAEDSASAEENYNQMICRKYFGPIQTSTDGIANVSAAQKKPVNELEEGFSSGDEQEAGVVAGFEDKDQDKAGQVQVLNGYVDTKPRDTKMSTTGNALGRRGIAKTLQGGFGESKPVSSASQDHNDTTFASVKRDPTAGIDQDVVLSRSHHEDEDEEVEEQPFVASHSLDMVAAAFGGGDEAEAIFMEEKAAAEEAEDEKVTSTALPGWGSWAGEGLSKRDKKQAASRARDSRLMKKEAGIKPADRKDAKLQRTIISEKRIKKNAKYLAPILPHPFETRQQYERSLRLPIGPEWTTKETFQNATKPRVMVKQGIIRPMERPLL